MTTCVRCSTEIKEEYLKKQYYQEEYPEILIGPYCYCCLVDTRICNGCQPPFRVGEVNKNRYCKECETKRIGT